MFKFILLILMLFTLVDQAESRGGRGGGGGGAAGGGGRGRGMRSKSKAVAKKKALAKKAKANRAKKNGKPAIRPIVPVAVIFFFGMTLWESIFFLAFCLACATFVFCYINIHYCSKAKKC